MKIWKILNIIIFLIYCYLASIIDLLYFDFTDTQMQLTPPYMDPSVDMEAGGQGTERLQCILRYLGVLWEGISLHISNGFGPL